MFYVFFHTSVHCELVGVHGEFMTSHCLCGTIRARNDRERRWETTLQCLQCCGEQHIFFANTCVYQPLIVQKPGKQLQESQSMNFVNLISFLYRTGGKISETIINMWKVTISPCQLGGNVVQWPMSETKSECVAWLTPEPCWKWGFVSARAFG